MLPLTAKVGPPQTVNGACAPAGTRNVGGVASGNGGGWLRKPLLQPLALATAIVRSQLIRSSFASRMTCDDALFRTRNPYYDIFCKQCL